MEGQVSKVEEMSEAFAKRELRAKKRCLVGEQAFMCLYIEVGQQEESFRPPSLTQESKVKKSGIMKEEQGLGV